jgi:Protein of unknown function (DUF4240)
VEAETFWRIVEAANNASHGDCRRQARLVTDALGELDPEEILAFERILDDLVDEAYRWDLWGAADLINRGASDDGFQDFRGWLIAQGRDVYQNALGDPDSLADHSAVASLGEFDTLWCQDLLAAPLTAYEKLTGGDPPEDQRPPAVLQGAKWDFDDETIMRRRYPRLWALIRSQ